MPIANKRITAAGKEEKFRSNPMMEKMCLNKMGSRSNFQENTPRSMGVSGDRDFRAVIWMDFPNAL